MQLGPYNSPMALARRPALALFWAVLAPSFFLYAVALLIDLTSGGWASAQFADGAGPAGAWTVLTTGSFALLVAMSLWSERIGAGPFGGPLPTSADWLAVAVITGPVILIVTSALLNLIMAGADPDWMYREGFDRSLFSRDALSLTMAAFIVVLAPLVEEIAFRGIGMGCLLARGWSPAAATLVTAGVFTALHFNYTPAGMVPVFIMGLYLGLLRVASGSMAAPILAHLSANGVSLALMGLAVT